MKRKLPPCWSCGRHLWGNHRKLLANYNDGLIRTLHKECAEKLMKEEPGEWEQINTKETK